jgi:hypothetical protein
MAAAPAAAAAMASVAVFFGRGFHSHSRGGERGKLLIQLARTAVRTFRSLPVGGADQDFAVAFALPAMKLVNWHGYEIRPPGQKLKRDGFRISAFPHSADYVLLLP